MEMVAPAGPMYQAGTLSGNPLAMTAGIETLKRLKDTMRCDGICLGPIVFSGFAVARWVFIPLALLLFQEPGSYEYLEKITNKLINGILDAAKENGHQVLARELKFMIYSYVVYVICTLT